VSSSQGGGRDGGRGGLLSVSEGRGAGVGGGNGGGSSESTKDAELGLMWVVTPVSELVNSYLFSNLQWVT